MAVNSCTPHVGGQTGLRAPPKVTPCPLGCLASSQGAGRKGLPAAEMQKHVRQRVEYWLFLFLLLFWMLTPCPATPCLFLKPFLFL